MEWTNEKALEFLELLYTEPCVWDPRENGYKNRRSQKEAWRRIQESLPFTATIDDLKKKKESLLGYYRVHLNRYKKSLESDDIYKTNWFAFELMDSFLRPLYEGNNSTLNIVDTSSRDKIETEAPEDEDEETIPISYIEIKNPSPSASHDQKRSSQAVKRLHSPRPNFSHSTGRPRFKMKKQPTDIIAAKKQIALVECIKTLSSHNQRKEYDEYDHFGLMIAAKIRKISSSLDRESVMNSIQNLVYKTISKNSKRRKSSSDSSHSES